MDLNHLFGQIDYHYIHIYWMIILFQLEKFEVDSNDEHGLPHEVSIWVYIDLLLRFVYFHTIKKHDFHLKQTDTNQNYKLFHTSYSF